MFADMNHDPEVSGLAIAEIVCRIVFPGPAAALPRNVFRPDMIEALQLHELGALRIHQHDALLSPDLVEHPRRFPGKGFAEEKLEILEHQALSLASRLRIPERNCFGVRLFFRAFSIPRICSALLSLCRIMAPGKDRPLFSLDGRT